MTQQLDPQPTDRVLEIGTGSGYQAAVLSAAGQGGLHDRNRPGAGRTGRQRPSSGWATRTSQLKIGDGYQGWAEHAPFDKIIVTCSPEKVPKPLVEQLREGGRLVDSAGRALSADALPDARSRTASCVVESREPTFFVPMTGQAEALRTASDERADDAAGQRRLRNAARSRQAGRLVLPAASRDRRRQVAGPTAEHCIRSAIACPAATRRRCRPSASTVGAPPSSSSTCG